MIQMCWKRKKRERERLMFEKNKKQHEKSRVYYMMKEQGFTSTVKNLLILQNRNRPRAISDFFGIRVSIIMSKKVK